MEIGLINLSEVIALSDDFFKSIKTAIFPVHFQITRYSAVVINKLIMISTNSQMIYLE